MGGVIDYVVGTPLTKVYGLGEHPDPKRQHHLSLYKMGQARFIPSSSPITSCISKRRTRSRALCCSAIGPPNHLAVLWLRSALLSCFDHCDPPVLLGITNYLHVVPETGNDAVGVA